MVVIKMTRLTAILCLCLWGAVATAQEKPLESEFTLFGGIRTGGEIEIEESDGVYAAEDASSFGLIWNTDHSRDTEWEIYFSRQDTEFELDDSLLVAPAVDLEMYTLQLGGTYLFDELGSSAVRSYIVMTLGGTHVKSDADGADSDTFLSGSIGLGLKFRKGERLGFRLEGRLHGVFLNDNSKLFCSTGPVENICAVQVEGDMLGQFEAFAGITFGF
jgi:hypothetical protein